MRKLISSGAFLLLGVGAASTAQAQMFTLKGSDTLELVTRDVINACTNPDGTALNTTMFYAGGGSGGGQSAMFSGLQQISPMSRELNGTSCVAGAEELVIGLDGISIVGANQPGLDSESTSGPTSCNDTISGGNRTMPVQFGGCSVAEIGSGACSPDGLTYTFKSWKDVLAMVYGGQNNGTAAQLTSGLRNPSRIDCGGNIRRTLVDSYGQIFTDSATGTANCRSTSCARVKHAFRRDDLSGTTDTFVSLVGLVTIPPFTTTFANGVPKVDSAATANPFCNAGEQKMNKGDSDYLDMDPIRRISDSDTAAHNRQGKEQVAQGFLGPINPPAGTLPPTLPGSGDAREIDDPAAVSSNNKLLVALPDNSHPAAQNWSYNPNITPLAGETAAQTTARSQQLQRDSYAKFVTGTNAGNAREGLGIVLPISVPSNYSPTSRAYWENPNVVSTAPVPCTVGKYAPSIICTSCRNIMCPDGGLGTCVVPVDTTILGTPTTPNYNCYSDRAIPKPPAGVVSLSDPRVYNLLVLDQGGKVVKDTYQNPSITLSATGQQRVVTAFYRLHTGEVTNFGGNPKIAGNPAPGTPSTASVCRTFDSTTQIGCLVQASACSVGYAGREANNNVTTFASQIQGAQNNVANIKLFVTANPAPAGSYLLARALYVNSFKGFGLVTNVASTPPDNELQLLNCFGGGAAAPAANDPRNPTSPVHLSIASHGFIPLNPLPADPVDVSFTTCPPN